MQRQKVMVQARLPTTPGGFSDEIETYRRGRNLGVQKNCMRNNALTMVGIAPQASMAVTFNALDDFNNTGVQPAPGNPFTYPFTYGTETIGMPGTARPVAFGFSASKRFSAAAGTCPSAT